MQRYVLDTNAFTREIICKPLQNKAKVIDFGRFFGGSVESNLYWCEVEFNGVLIYPICTLTSDVPQDINLISNSILEWIDKAYLINESMLSDDCIEFIYKNLQHKHRIAKLDFEFRGGRNSLFLHLRNYLTELLNDKGSTHSNIELYTICMNDFPSYYYKNRHPATDFFN